MAASFDMFKFFRKPKEGVAIIQPEAETHVSTVTVTACLDMFFHGADPTSIVVQIEVPVDETEGTNNIWDIERKAKLADPFSGFTQWFTGNHSIAEPGYATYTFDGSTYAATVSRDLLAYYTISYDV